MDNPSSLHGGENKDYEDLFFARQPIFDSNLNLWAYEFLYRHRLSSENAVFLDDHQATLKVLAAMPLCLDIAEEKSISIVNFPSKAIVDQIHKAYPSNQIIIQLNDSDFNETGLMDAIKILKEDGYYFSFDNFEGNQEHKKLCHLADFITIDMLYKKPNEIRELVDQCKNEFPGSALIALRIEDYDEYSFAKMLGFNYFQGFFFKRPQVFTGRKISSNKASKIKILQLIQKKDIEFKEISVAIATDVSIVHRLMVYLNSPAIGIRKKIDTIEEALVIIGLGPLKKWLQIILLTDVKHSDKPNELVLLSVQRACFLELIAIENNLDSRKDSLFLLGLFSLIDAILDHPKEKILSQLSLSAELEKTILGKPSNLSAWLDLIDSCETCDSTKIKRTAEQLHINTTGLFSSYEKAYSLAKQFF